MIVELYGCPGCGKTYLVHKITGQNNTVAMSDNKLKNSLISTAKKLSMLAPESINLRNELLNVVRNENHKKIYIDRTVKYFVDNITLLGFGYMHLNKDIFMAEGIVHRLVAMAVNFGWNAETIDKLMDKLIKYLHRINPVYLEVDSEICFESVKARNRHESEMDELTDDKLRQYIEDFLILFDHITTKYNYTTITRDDYSALEELLK